jgi:PAS domain S-box-containing protein
MMSEPVRSERNRAENGLAEKQKLLEAILTATPDIVYIYNAQQQKHVYFNREVRELLGYSSEEIEQAGADILLKNVHPDDLPRVMRHIEFLADTASDDLFSLEYRIKGGGGDYRWFYVREQVYERDAQGKPELLFGVVQDLTQRKQANQALRDAEAKYRSLVEQLPSITYIVTFGEQNDASYISPQIESLLGFSQEEWLANPDLWVQQLHPDDRERVMAEFKLRDSLGQPVNIDYRLLTREGQVRWFHDQSVLISDDDGKPHYAHGMLFDITERKEIEERLRDNEKRFRALIENSSEEISLLGHDGRLLYESPSANPTLGYAPGQFLGQDLFQLVHPEDLERLQRLFMHLVQEPGFHVRDEFRLRHRSGEWRWVEGVGTNLLSEPAVQAIVVNYHDVSERKRAEAERQALVEIRQGLATTQDLQEFLRLIHQAIGKVIYAENFFVVFHNPKTGLFEEVYSVDKYDPPAPPSSLEKSITSYVFRTEEPLIITQEKFDELVQQGEVELVGTNSESWLGVPLKTPGGAIGVMVLQDYEQPNRYSEQDKEFLASIAGQLSLAIESKRAEEKLRESEVRLSGIVTSAMDAIVTLDETQHIVLFNPAAEALFQRKAWDAIGKPIENFIPERFRNAHAKDIARFKETGTTNRAMGHLSPLSALRADGTEFPIEASISQVEAGGQRLYTVILRDITERKQAETETFRHLAELEALYENGLAISRLMEPSEIGNRIIETIESYLSWHHVTIRLRPAESDDLELIAFSVSDQKGEEEPDIRQQFNGHISKVGQGLSGWVVQTGLPIYTGNVHAHSQYVDTYEGMMSGMYVPLKIGERVIGCISVESAIADAFSAQDERLLATIANQAAAAFESARLYQTLQQELSERRHAEELLENERNSLAQRVEERTTALSRANINLARALRVKDEFLANMSHELRTPLNAILGLSESLEEQIAGPLNEKQEKYVATIRESGHHLLSLINDILDLAKIEAGQITLDITKVHVDSICQASLRLIKQLAQKKNQDVALEIDEGLGWIWADERRLKQMIVNLLSNAVKFTPENGKIGLEVHGDEKENRVTLTVWDSGIGIKEADLPRLFKPFVQLDSGFGREAGGTGLGLALVAEMARMHGGRVGVQSQPKQGSRFSIVLPWEPALAVDTVERMKTTGKFRAIKPGVDQRTILLVEDTQEVVMMLKDYLERAGYRVVTAKDGLDGIDQAKRTHPDLILMDLQMPRMNGLEATAKLRSDPDFKHTPIIALTALAMSGDRERCIAAGMDEYISKPVNLKALVKIIQSCLPDKVETKPE